MTSGKPELQTTVINSITVDSYLRSWETDSNLGRSTIKSMYILLTKNVDTVLTTDKTLNGKAVTVQRGIITTTEQYIFRGEVVNVFPDGGILRVLLADKLYETTKKTVTKSWDINIDSEAGKISEIFLTLINDYTTLTADATTVQDSGTIFTIKKFTMRAATVFNGLERLAELLGWQFYYDPDDDKVYFEPKGYTNQSTTFETGVNVLVIPKWEYDSSELYNVIEVRGAQQEVETTESGRIGTTSGYTTSSITLINNPISVKLFLDASDPPTTLKTGGVSGSTSSYDYSVDTNNKLIEANPSFTDTHYAEIRYSYMLPIPVIVSDPVSILQYSPDPNNPAPKKKVIHKEDILEVADAELYAAQFLADHKDPIEKVKRLFVTNVSDAEIGQSVLVIDNFNGITGYYIITRLKKSYPYRADEVTIVSNIIEEENYDVEIEARIKRLEERNASEDDLLLHVISLGSNITFENRYNKLEKRDIAGTETLIWGHFTFGIWGTGKWNDDASLGSYTTSQMIQGSNIYKEFFYDTDFDGSGTATWDTGNKELSFTAGQTRTTDEISKGTKHTYFKVELGAVTGSILTEIAGGGGSTWETVTLNTRTLFGTSSTAGVKLRFTENGASTAKIENTYNADGSYNEPGIKVTLEQ